MNLSDRKKKILQIVVDDYISTAQPVSSKSITDKHMKDVSSATVRSELAQLEELGFLDKQHTSSGRVPSAEAYKLYANELMKKSKLSSKELAVIKNTFLNEVNNLETVVKNTVKVISELTDYTSLGFAKHDEEEKVQKVNLFRYKENQALLLIVTENTLIKDKFITIPKEMADEQLEVANNLVNRLFVGKDFAEILSFSDSFLEEFNDYRDIFTGVIKAIESYLNNENAEVVLEGEEKILNSPEYEDANKIKNFLSVVNSKDKVASLLAENSSNIEINIKIGGDNEESMKECSLVTASYKAGGVNLGTYGVIGPLRMDYKKVVSVLESVGKVLEDMLKDK
ncbi:MAG: heat-inducible transcription repressor HrcA [Clostridiales bacterium]|nr:heat-inducible transcription repressor HrcA [Clostridiales bacterium]